MLLALALAATLQQGFDFYTFAPYRTNIERPERILGYGPGGRHTTYHDQDRVIDEIVAKAGDRVKRVVFGNSTEGRPLRILAITSPNNLKRLDQILKQNQDVADGKVAPSAIPKDLPVVVWINQCIHGNESASFESAMWLAYTLAASDNKEVKDILDKAVVVINPSYNPDGHERFVVWYNSLARGDKSDDAIEQQEQGILNGRGNHYRFDLNRDRVAMSQVETRQEVAEFRKWNPHVYVDQHGQVGTYFFPPVAQSIHKDIDRDRYIELSTILGKDTAKAFDEHGWRYFVRETFDFYGAVYLDTWSSFNGAIGLTHETDGGGALASERQDGSTVTLLDGIKKHFTSAIAVLRSATTNKDKFLASSARFHQEAVQGKGLADKRTLILTGDDRVLARLRTLLDDQGIESSLVEKPISVKARSFLADQSQDLQVPSGSLVVDMAQPRGRLAMAMLDKGQDFEPDFTARQLKIREGLNDPDQYPGRDGIEFYDITGWSIPLAWGIDAYWTAEQITGSQSRKATAVSIKFGTVGAFVRYEDQTDAIAIAMLLHDGVRVHVATKPMTVDGSTLPQGTFFVFWDRNEPDAEKKLLETAMARHIATGPLNTSFPSEGVVGPGSDSVVPLTKPNIAIVFGDQPNGTRFGSAWFVFEKVFDLPFTAISQRALNGDLSTYTAIVLPPGARPTAQLKTWVQNGGVAIALGNSAFIGEDWIDIKPNKLKVDKDPTDLPGAIFRASLNPRSPLAYGYDTAKPVAVPVAGSTFYKRKEEGGGVVLLGDDPTVLSGWSWPDEQAAYKDTVWLHDEPLGRGHLVWFAQDPTDRAMWPGTYKMLLNAVLMGG